MLTSSAPNYSCDQLATSRCWGCINRVENLLGDRDKQRAAANPFSSLIAVLPSIGSSHSPASTSIAAAATATTTTTTTATDPHGHIPDSSIRLRPFSSEEVNSVIDGNADVLRGIHMMVWEVLSQSKPPALPIDYALQQLHTHLSFHLQFPLRSLLQHHHPPLRRLLLGRLRVEVVLWIDLRMQPWM